MNLNYCNKTKNGFPRIKVSCIEEESVELCLLDLPVKVVVPQIYQIGDFTAI